MSLNLSFFKQKFKELGGAFTASETRIDKLSTLYYNHLDPKLTDRQYGRTIDYACISLERFPTIKTLLEISRGFVDPKPKEETIACTNCNGTGTIRTSYTYFGQTYYPIFKCPLCYNCSSEYPIYDESYKNKGYKKIDGPTWNYSRNPHQTARVGRGEAFVIWERDDPPPSKEGEVEDMCKVSELLNKF